MAISALLFFTALWIIPSILFLPAAKRAIVFLSPSQKENAFLASALAPALGVATFLVVFSLLARVLPSYGISVFTALCFLFFIVKALSKFLPDNAFRIRALDFLPLAILFCTHILFWLPRLWFSDIHYDPNFYGAEKLFNLSLQQSFSYSTQYPPQSLWLAGEAESYYILPRVLPGLATHFAIDFANAKAQIAGVFFHLSDTFYNALAVLTLGASANIVLAKVIATKHRRAALVVFVAVFPFLAAPARVLHQIANTQIDFWSLSRIIPFTINEYPFWNYLFADNHAHNNVAFLDIVVTFFLLALLQNALLLSRIEKAFAGIVTGVCITALAMSQSGSAFIAAVVFLIPVIVMMFKHFRKRRLVSYGEPFAWILLATLTTLIPDILARQRPRVLWHVVPSKLASTPLDFLNVNFAFFIAISAVIILFARPLQSLPQALRSPFLHTVLVLSGIAWLVGYPAVAITALAGLAIAWALAPAKNSQRTLALSLLVGFSLLTIFPELIGVNFNMGPNYIRFNTTFKFLYTSFFIIPLAIVFVATLVPPPNFSPWRRRTGATIIIVFCVVFLTAQGFTLRNRTQSPPTTGGPSGLEFLAHKRPFDNAIIDFLNTLPPHSVLAEECGMPPKPTAYSVAGRVAAYSGRPTLCGWGMHSFLHHETFRAKPRTGKPVWNHLLEVNEAITALLNETPQSSSHHSLFQQADTQTLVRAGATHFVFGEYEKELHPNTSLAKLARATNGHIVFEHAGFGVVALPKTEARAP